MKIIAFKHFSFDDEYALASWAKDRGHTLTVRDPANGIDPKWLEDNDCLVILGGPMSVYQEEKHRWLIEEKQFVKQAIQMNKKVLGICLGAQMLAEVLGSKVYRNKVKEIGWHSVQRTKETHPWFDEMPQQFHSFQWHGDTFDLPSGSKWLAFSEGCRNQAFSFGENVLALQFHLETTPACIEQMLTRWTSEIVPAPFIQTADEIRERAQQSKISFSLLHRILDRIAYD